MKKKDFKDITGMGVIHTRKTFLKNEEVSLKGLSRPQRTQLRLC